MLTFLVLMARLSMTVGVALFHIYYVEYGEIVKLCNSKNHSIAIIIELRMKIDQVIELKPH